MAAARPRARARTVWDVAALAHGTALTALLSFAGGDDHASGVPTGSEAQVPWPSALPQVTPIPGGQRSLPGVGAETRGGQAWVNLTERPVTGRLWRSFSTAHFSASQ